MLQCAITQLCDHIISSRNDTRRVLVALAGPPGSGKTTLSVEIARGIDAIVGKGSAAVLPLDGFHHDNDSLQQIGLLDRKGAPETFDVAGFAALVEAARRDNGPLSYPTFDRVADKVQPDARMLEAGIRFVICEGNYLLLQQGGWAALPDLFDVTIMLRADKSHLRKRLVARWLQHGLAPSQAEARTDGNDMVNAALVLEHSAKPDVTLVALPDDRITVESADNIIRRAG